MNNNGKGSGLTLILMLVVALIVAWLVMTQMGSLGIGGSKEEAQKQESYVDEAQDAVDEYNDMIGQQGEDYNE